MRQSERTGDIATWTGFLIMAFAIVGLLGAFATYAAQIPFDRAMARSQALDQAVAAAGTPDPKAALDALRPRLGDSADALLAAPLPGPGGIAARAAAERSRMLAELHADSEDYGFRLRIVIAAFTATAALFGCMVISIVRGR
jgi:hypothetical protein